MKHLAALFGKVYVYRRGRVVALAFLLLFAGVVLWADVSTSGRTQRMPWLTTPLTTLRQLLFDGYQRALPRKLENQTVAVVGIDEDSIKVLGQWPWPRDRMADLLRAISAHRPAAIGLDMYMPEPDQTSPDQVALRLPRADTAALEALRKMPSHDAQLAQALRDTPSVLGAAGFEFQTLSTSEALRTTPVLVHGGDVLEHLQRFPFVVASLRQLQDAAPGQALVSIEDRAVVRRVPLVSAVRDLVVPSLAMEMLRVATQSPHVEVDADAQGVRQVRVADVVVPTQPGGDVWLHFARAADGDAMRNIPALTLLQGRAAPEALEGKLVLIGLTGWGLNDRRVTALGESVPGIEIQAQLLESMLDGRMLLRPWWMKWVEAGLLLAIGLSMVVWVPDALGRISATGVRQPRRVGLWVSVLVLGLLALGFWLFHAQGLLFDGVTMSLGYAGLLASLVSSATLQLERENHRLGVERQQLREDAARVAGEMEAARRIQLGSLPNAQRAFPGETRFAIDAVIEPAREVGGDLYDFFLIDGRRLYFLIGDVSGKGVPASLFMSVTKTLTRSFAARLSGGTEEIVTAANLDLSRDNVETLFVTMLVGLLDLKTGELQLVNAGHDAPWCIREDGRLEHLTVPPEAGGPPLCMVADFQYRVHRIQLRPGDRLCMVTDGITEAANAHGELYGGARLQAVLAALPPDPTPVDITGQVRADVARFVDGAEASDDLAILVLHWLGPAVDATAP